MNIDNLLFTPESSPNTVLLVRMTTPMNGSVYMMYDTGLLCWSYLVKDIQHFLNTLFRFCKFKDLPGSNYASSKKGSLIRRISLL